MRDALNQNPVAQIAVVAVLLVVVGLLFATRVLKGEDTGQAPPEAASTTSDLSAGAPADASAATATDSASAASAAPPPAPVPADLVPGPGLPKRVLVAYARDRTVVLLVVRNGGIEDRLVRDAVRALRAEPNVEVFVTPAKGIAHYSRITRGVGVTRVPALVVVRPRRVGGAVPEAEVTYGFQSGASVAQAARDALYAGRTVPYHPE
jgi:hypothetical protein